MILKLITWMFTILSLNQHNCNHTNYFIPTILQENNHSLGVGCPWKGKVV